MPEYLNSLTIGRAMKIQLMVGNESNIGSRIGIPGGNTFNRSQNRGRGGRSIRGRRGGGGAGAGGRGRGGQRGQRFLTIYFKNIRNKHFIFLFFIF